MSAPVEWRNNLGQVSYQPRLSDGRRLWWIALWAETLKEWGGSGVAPVLYRSPHRAERIARRQENRECRGSWREFREAAP